MQTPLGNAVLATLPPGTVLVLPKPDQAMSAAFANEIASTGAVLRTTASLLLCTPAYIAERDERELRLVEALAAPGRQNPK
jgi:hypothetical protein